MKNRKTERILLISTVLLAVPVIVFSQTDVLTTLAGRIAEKRSRVEALSNEVELAKTQYNEQLRSLASQIADVEIQINREKLRLEQIDQDITRARSVIETARDSVAEIDPLIASVIARYRDYVETHLPFQTPERLQEIETLERLFTDGSIDAAMALSRLWNTLESEFRLATENGLYRQTIEVSGEYQLAEVVRLGMVLLYFKTFDDRFGYAVPGTDGAWFYTLASSRQEQEMIGELFDSMRRNLREGSFLLPNPLAAATREGGTP